VYECVVYVIVKEGKCGRVQENHSWDVEFLYVENTEF
jgi:hypothetical protein